MTLDGPTVEEEHLTLRDASVGYFYGSPNLSVRGGSLRGGRPDHRRISTRLRWTVNGLAMLASFLFSGILFGWAPLKMILIREGQFRETCHADATTTTTDVDNSSGSTYIPCTNQLVEFNFIFTIAQFCLNLASLPVGFFLDHASKTLHFTIAGLLTVGGLVLFAVSDSDTFNYFTVAYSLLAFAGCMTLLGSFPGSFLLPTYQAAILAASSCLFDASSLVFAVFNPLNSNYPELFSRQNLFLGYSVLAMLLYGSMIFCWWQLERRDWKSVVDAEAAQSKEDTKMGAEERQNETSQSVDGSPLDDMNGATASTISKHLQRVKDLGLHEMALDKQIRTFDFALVLLFVSFHMLRTNFLIESVNEIVATYGDDDGFYAKVFGFVLPAGVFFIPFIEYTISKYGVVASLDVTNVLGVVWGTILLIPILPLQAFNFLIFTGFRAYLYSTLSNFIAMTFGVATMGRVIGFSFTTSAVFTLLQYPAASFAEDGPEPEFTAVNSLSLGLCLVPILLVYYYKHLLTTGFQKSKTAADQGASETTALL